MVKVPSEAASELEAICQASACMTSVRILSTAGQRAVATVPCKGAVELP